MSADNELVQEPAQDDEQGSTPPIKQHDDDPTGTPVRPYSDIHVPAPPAALQNDQPTGTPVRPYSDIHVPAPPEALQADGEPAKPSDEYVSGGEGA